MIHMTDTPNTRITLIRKIRDRNDAQAWEEFVDLYHPTIISICRRKGLQHADANDIAQEVLARVSSSIEQFTFSGSRATFRGWLYRITRNLTMDYFRKQNREPEIADAAETHLIGSSDESKESDAFRIEFQRQVFIRVANQVRGQCSHNAWQAFWQVDVEQRSPDEVAAELNITRGALYVSKSRVIAKLRKAAQELLDETL